MGSISQTLRTGLFGVVLAITCSACAEKTPPVAAKPPVTREQILTLSPRAAEQVRLLCTRGKLKPDAVVVISVEEGNYFRFKNGGDKRYRYTLAFDDDPKNVDDYVVMESQGLTIHVAKSAADFLRGTEVMLVEVGGGKGGFKFQNPNEMMDDESAQAPLIPVADPTNSKAPGGPTPIKE